MDASDVGQPALPAASAASARPAEAAASRPAAAPEAALVIRARAGERAAFARLYESYAPAVHGVLLTLVPRSDADDLVQDVFLRALASIGELRDDRVGPWLCAIARNRARDAHRRSGPQGQRVELEESMEPTTTDTNRRDEQEQAQHVLEVVRTLPSAYCETLTLRLVEGLSGPEIAAATGLTHGSVRVNLHRGMKLLRDRLQAMGWPGGTR